MDLARSTSFKRTQFRVRFYLISFQLRTFYVFILFHGDILFAPHPYFRY